MRSLRYFLLALIVSPTLPWSAEKAAGTLSGQVFREAEGKRTPYSAGAVRLSIRRGNKEISGAESKTDKAGSYRLAGIPLEPGLTYRVYVDEAGVPFEAPPAPYASIQKTKRLPDVVVTPVTSDVSALATNEITAIQFSKTNIFRITRALRIRNPAPIAYDSRANRGIALAIPLQAGGFDLEYHRGLSDSTTEIDAANHRLLLGLRIPAQSDYSLEFSYLYRFSDRSVDLDLTLPIPRQQVSLLMTGRDATLKSPRFQKGEAETIEGVTYASYTGGPFNSGEAISAKVRGLTLPKDLPFALVAIGSLLVLLAGVFFWFRKTTDDARSTRLTSEKALQALLQVEQDYRKGLLTHSEYRDARERWTDFLVDQRQTAPDAA